MAPLSNPDMTVFEPAVALTCVPGSSSNLLFCDYCRPCNVFFCGIALPLCISVFQKAVCSVSDELPEPEKLLTSADVDY